MRQLLQKICCFWQAGSLQKYPPPPGVADINLNSPGEEKLSLTKAELEEAVESLTTDYTNQTAARAQEKAENEVTKDTIETMK